MDYQLVTSNVLETMKNMPFIDWLATITGINYVLLAARENIWCWFFGIISCTAWAYSTYFNYDLYFDAILQIFYVLMSFVGIYQWKFGAKEEQELSISTMTIAHHLTIGAIGILGGLLFGYLFDEYTPAAATYLDAITTIFAIATTILVIQKKLENWLYWIVINAVYIYIYLGQEAYLFALNMVIYLLIAISGYLKWRKNYSANFNHL